MPKIFISSVIDAPADAVWARIRDFNGIADWHPAIASSEIEDGRPSDSVGCIRSFYLGDGGHIREQLLELSDTNRFYTYSILVAPLAVRNYVATLGVTPVTDGNRTYARWTAEFDCDAAEEAGLVDLISNGVFQGGFDALKAHFGA